MDSSRNFNLILNRVRKILFSLQLICSEDSPSVASIEKESGLFATTEIITRLIKFSVDDFIDQPNYLKKFADS